MQELERHVSQDGILILRVWEDDGDISIGFENFVWHTHGDLLAGSYGLGETEAIRQFVDAILNDELPVIIQKRDGKFSDIWITQDPPADALEDLRQYGEPNETLEIRFWSGKAVNE
jgi:hypothetical protein